MDKKQGSVLDGPLTRRLNRSAEKVISQINDAVEALETQGKGRWMEANTGGGTTAEVSEKTDSAGIKLHGYRKNRTYNGFYMTYIKELVAELIRDKDSFRQIVPFEEAWIADNWRYVVGYSEAKKEPHLPAVVMMTRFPMASCGAMEQIRKYGHYIFAYNDEYFLLGVPGIGSGEEQPDGGASGFALWHHMKGSDRYGYWLALIERNTGIITEIS